MPTGKTLLERGCSSYERYPYRYLGGETNEDLYLGLYSGPTGAVTPVAIVAVVSLVISEEGDEYMIDWAAYIGGDPNTWADVHETATKVRRFGNKLPEAIARAMFPLIDLRYRL